MPRKAVLISGIALERDYLKGEGLRSLAEAQLNGALVEGTDVQRSLNHGLAVVQGYQHGLKPFREGLLAGLECEDADSHELVCIFSASAGLQAVRDSRMERECRPQPTERRCPHGFTENPSGRRVVGYYVVSALDIPRSDMCRGKPITLAPDDCRVSSDR